MLKSKTGHTWLGAVSAVVIYLGSALMGQELAFEKFVLDNGLTVILHRDPSLPLVAVNLWYRVGSKDETAGRSGFAHLFEHLMFMGTDRVPGSEFDEIMEAGGGSNNASTSEDRTNYYASGPSHLLETLLWLEADRMEALGKAMTQEKLDVQRDVVRNERRQTYENQPYAKSWLELPSLLYPKTHPYDHPVIGSHEDLEAASVDDVKEFFATWYVPNNASLVVAGDFEADAAKTMVRRLFASIPAGPKPPHRKAAAPKLSGVITKTVSDEVPTPRTTMVWVSPPHFQAGDAELDLFADLLADGAASRLQRVLVQEKRLAQDVSARQDSGTLNSLFFVSATALPGVALKDLEAAIDAELRSALEKGPIEEEVRRVVAKEEASVVRELQDLLSRADQLNMYEIELGDPQKLSFDLDRYRKATPEGIRSHARQVLDLDHRVILRVVPAKEFGSVAGSSARDQRPSLGVTKDWTPPIPKVIRTLGGDGPELWVLERRTAPLLSLEWVIPIGAASDPKGRAGATALLADLMTEGASGRSASQFAEAADRLGSQLRVAAGRHTTSIGLSSLSRNLDESLDLLADLLLRPTLDAKEYDRVRSVRLAELEQRAKSPSDLAALASNRRLREAMGVPGDPVAGYTKTVAETTIEDLRALHANLIKFAAYGHIIVSGDVEAGSLHKKLEARFAVLKKSPVIMPHFPKTLEPSGLHVFLVDRRDAPQTLIRFHRDSVTYSSPRLPALLLINIAFGGSFTSRLNQNLREDHGFTYGASSRIIVGEFEGSFVAASSVKTEVTIDAVREFLNEFSRLNEPDFSEEELQKAKATRRSDLVKSFETVAETTSEFAHLAEAQLSADTLADLFRASEEQDLDDVNSVAKLCLGNLEGVLVLVGDRDRILPGLEALKLGKITLLDEEGRPVLP